MGKFIDTLGTQVASTIGNVASDYLQRGADNIFGIDRKAEQLEQQGKLNELQIKGNKELANYSMGLEKQMFDYTFAKQSPEAMKKLYEEAGLNPALLMGGASNVGGTTTGSQSAGQVSGSKASTEAEQIQANVARQGMALQLAKVQSEIDVNKSIAEANRAGAGKSTAEIDKIWAETDIAREMAWISKIDADFAYEYKRVLTDKLIGEKNVLIQNEELIKNNILLIGQNIRKIDYEIDNLKSQKNLTDEQIKQVKQMIIESLAKISLMNAQKRESIAGATETELNNILLKDVTDHVGGTELTIGKHAMPVITTILKSILNKSTKN